MRAGKAQQPATAPSSSDHTAADVKHEDGGSGTGRAAHESTRLARDRAVIARPGPSAEHRLLAILPSFVSHLKPTLAAAVTQELLANAEAVIAARAELPRRVSETILRLLLASREQGQAMGTPDGQGSGGQGSTPRSPRTRNHSYSTPDPDPAPSSLESLSRQHSGSFSEYASQLPSLVMYRNPLANPMGPLQPAHDTLPSTSLVRTGLAHELAAMKGHWGDGDRPKPGHPDGGMPRSASLPSPDSSQLLPSPRAGSPALVAMGSVDSVTQPPAGSAAGTDHGSGILLDSMGSAAGGMSGLQTLEAGPRRGIGRGGVHRAGGTSLQPLEAPRATGATASSAGPSSCGSSEGGAGEEDARPSDESTLGELPAMRLASAVTSAFMSARSGALSSEGPSERLSGLLFDRGSVTSSSDRNSSQLLPDRWSTLLWDLQPSSSASAIHNRPSWDSQASRVSGSTLHGSASSLPLYRLGLRPGAQGGGKAELQGLGKLVSAGSGGAGIIHAGHGYIAAAGGQDSLGGAGRSQLVPLDLPWAVVVQQQQQQQQQQPGSASSPRLPPPPPSPLLPPPPPGPGSPSHPPALLPWVGVAPPPLLGPAGPTDMPHSFELPSSLHGGGSSGAWGSSSGSKEGPHLPPPPAVVEEVLPLRHVAGGMGALASHIFLDDGSPIVTTPGDLDAVTSLLADPPSGDKDASHSEGLLSSSPGGALHQPLERSGSSGSPRYLALDLRRGGGGSPAATPGNPQTSHEMRLVPVAAVSGGGSVGGGGGRSTSPGMTVVQEVEGEEDDTEENPDEDVATAVALLLRKHYPGLATALRELLEAACSDRELLQLAAAARSAQPRSLDVVVNSSLHRLLAENRQLRARVKELERVRVRAMMQATTSAPSTAATPPVPMLGRESALMGSSARSMGSSTWHQAKRHAGLGAMHGGSSPTAPRSESGAGSGSGSGAGASPAQPAVSLNALLTSKLEAAAGAAPASAGELGSARSSEAGTELTFARRSSAASLAGTLHTLSDPHSGISADLTHAGSMDAPQGSVDGSRGSGSGCSSAGGGGGASGGTSRRRRYMHALGDLPASETGSPRVPGEGREVAGLGEEHEEEEEEEEAAADATAQADDSGALHAQHELLQEQHSTQWEPVPEHANMAAMLAAGISPDAPSHAAAGEAGQSSARSDASAQAQAAGRLDDSSGHEDSRSNSTGKAARSLVWRLLPGSCLRPDAALP